MKLAPYIGDGNIINSSRISSERMKFETSPVYRGRKLLISMLSNNELTRMFETSPVYRGWKLLQKLLELILELQSLKLAPYIEDGNMMRIHIQ